LVEAQQQSPDATKDGVPGKEAQESGYCDLAFHKQYVIAEL
jgi:hypothetical protein